MEQKTKKTLGTVIGLIVGLGVAAMIQQFVFKAPSFDKAMMHAASELNKSCPIMVDQETRLDNTAAYPDNVFQYNYTLVNYVKDSIDSQLFVANMRPLILNNIKTNPDLKAYRDQRVTMAYNYKDKHGEFVTKISITADEYMKIDK